MPESSSEFRSVHAAQDALQKYLASKKNLDVIRNIAIQHIERYDVWQCVFEKEPEAYRELMIKEWYSILAKYSNKSIREDVVTATIGMLAISMLERITEFKLPLSIDDGIKLILDCCGNDFLPVLKEEAANSVKRKREIIHSYIKKDNEWVGYSKAIVNALNKI